MQWMLKWIDPITIIVTPAAFNNTLLNNNNYYCATQWLSDVCVPEFEFQAHQRKLIQAELIQRIINGPSS